MFDIKEGSLFEFPYNGTKKKLFLDSIDLFSKHSYESVSMKDIAKSSKIKTSSIYNHFDGKEEILNAIFNFYLDFHKQILDGYMGIKDNFEDKTPIEIVEEGFFYHEPELENVLVKIIKILFDLKSRNKKAHGIFHDVIFKDGRQSFIDRINEMIRLEMIYPCDADTISTVYMEYAVYSALQAVAGEMISPEIWEKKMICLSSMLEVVKR